MRVISHRGNIDGPDKSRENNIDAIFNCINRNLSVEIDVHAKDGQLFIDHDGPVKNNLSVSEFCKTFENFEEYLWIHCKNLEALVLFNQPNMFIYNYFGHSNDDFVLTSHGFIFTRPGVSVNSNVVCVMPELGGVKDEEVKKYDFVLTDYPLRYV